MKLSFPKFPTITSVRQSPLLRTRKIYRAVVAILAVLAVSHSRFLMSRYFAGEITVVTNATFYNEKNPLQMPDFLLCFSKVFSYSKITPHDIQQLYSGITLTSSSHMSYHWELNITDVVIAVRVNNATYNPAMFFSSIVYLSSQTCWHTNAHNFKTGRAGRVHFIDFIINAAVYDDITINYNSPIPYLTVVPYFASAIPAESIPDTRSSVHISPGRFSSIGFSWRTMDSSQRRKQDETTCNTNRESTAQCNSIMHKQLSRQQCGRADAVNATYFASCALQLPVIHASCLIEPCMADLFRFTKSEGYIKYDSYLSSLLVSSDTRQRLRKDIATAARLNSQFNPDVKGSFRDLAHNMADLTSQIARALGQPRGHICAQLQMRNYSLISVIAESTPNVIAESEYMSNLRKAFIGYSEKTLHNVLSGMVKFAKNNLLETTFPYILPQELKNSEHSFNRTANKILKKEIGKFSNFLFTVFAALDSLRRQLAVIINNYTNLQFTRFIERFSSHKQIAQFNHLLNSTIRAAKRLKQQLFEGSHQTKKYFGHDDENKKTTHILGPAFSTLKYGKTIVSAYGNDTGKQYAWLLSKRVIDPNIGSPHIFQTIYGYYAHEVTILALVYIICGFYQNYLAIAERYHGHSASFSIRQLNSPLELIHDYVVFVIGHIFLQYDTSTLLSVEHDFLEGAEQRSCGRLSSVNPIYVEKNESYRKVLKAFKNKYSKYFGYLAGPGPVVHRSAISSSSKAAMDSLFEYVRQLIKFKAESNHFEQYYKEYVTRSMGSAVHDVTNLRHLFAKFQTFNTQDQRHKVFLINRLMVLATLIERTENGDSEEKISHYLSKKGRILIGEIQIEMAEVTQELSTARFDYSRYRRSMYDVRARILHSNSIKSAVMKGVMTSHFHSSSGTQRVIMENLKNCNDEKWRKINRELNHIIRITSQWLKNMTTMVTRARRYTKALELSKEFMRQNLMHISLYYDSMTVLHETMEPLHSAKSLLSQFGAVLRIYLRMTMFRILNILSVILSSIVFRLFILIV